MNDTLRLAPSSYARGRHSGRLLVLACSETKTDEPGRIPAYQRYDGPLWQTLRAVDPSASLARVGFLSAHLGFRHASTPIETYNARLTPDLSARMIAGGMIARWPADKRPGRMPIGVHPGCEIAHLASEPGFGKRPFKDVALVGGHLYVDVMRSFVAGFREMGLVTAGARVVEINATIGVMRQQLRAWLQSAVVDSLPDDCNAEAVSA